MSASAHLNNCVSSIRVRHLSGYLINQASEKNWKKTERFKKILRQSALSPLFSSHPELLITISMLLLHQHVVFLYANRHPTGSLGESPQALPLQEEH